MTYKVKLYHGTVHCSFNIEGCDSMKLLEEAWNKKEVFNFQQPDGKFFYYHLDKFYLMEMIEDAKEVVNE